MAATVIAHLCQWVVKVTSPYGLSLLPVWAGGRSHFSLLSWASRTPAQVHVMSRNYEFHCLKFENMLMKQSSSQNSKLQLAPNIKNRKEVLAKFALNVNVIPSFLFRHNSIIKLT